MNEVLKNPWKPLPIAKVEAQEIKTAKVNEDVAPQSFKVIIEASPDVAGKGITV